MNADPSAEPSSESGPPQGASVGGGPTGADRGGVTIPGYQPVEFLGNAPSFGKWVKAVQVRMDRHVLLKVLKPGVPVAHEFFSREISTMVRLDGEGVLRAIDEGTVKGFRYLVLDEADGIQLSASSVGGEEGWCALTRTALELWRRVLERECVLLPIPAVSWRRLPAGDFSSADLGWLVPIGDKIPSHPWLAPNLSSRDSRPHDAIGCFDATGKELAKALEVPLPGSWRRASDALASVPEDAQFEDVLRAFIDAKEVVEPPKTQRTLVWAVAGLILVAGLVWGTVHVMTRGAASPKVVGVSDVDVPSDRGNGVETIEPPPVDPLLLEKQRLEELAWIALDELVPDRADEAELPTNTVLDNAQVALLSQLVIDHPGTRAAALAATELEIHRIAAFDDITSQLWATTLGVEKTLAEGQIAEAEGLVVALRAHADESKAFGSFPELESPFERLSSTVAAMGAQSLDQLSARIAAAIREREFRRGAIEVNRAVPGLLASDQVWAEEQRLGLLETAGRYERVKRAVERGIARAADLTAQADFNAAVREVAFVDGEAEFPELVSRRREWVGHFDRARATAHAIATELESKARESKRHAYVLVGDEKLQGRIQSVAPGRFTLRLDGLRKVREIHWLELAPEQWSQLAGENLAEEQRLLVETLLGSDVALERASKLDPVPAWTADARRRLERAANADLNRLLTAGRTALSAGNGTAARRAALAIAAEIPPELWSEERSELAEWCSVHWLEVGPGEAFPGASVSWKPDRSIEIDFDFSNPEATRAWVPARAGLGTVTHAKGSMVTKRSVWLAPGGHADLFEDQLRVSTTLATTEAPSPNLNVVLFAHLSTQGWAGDLFGLGFRPPTALRIEGAVPVFFPANVIGPLVAAELGKGDELQWAEPRPKITRGMRVDLELASLASSVELRWKDVLEKAFPAESSRRRLGTVEFRSYHAKILVGDTKIRGRISEQWWERWVEERVEEDLAL